MVENDANSAAFGLVFALDPLLLAAFGPKSDATRPFNDFR
jgi:hypothetical protein